MTYRDRAAGTAAAGKWPWWSFLFAMSISMSLFGFLVVGAYADSHGLGVTRGLSLVLRYGAGMIILGLLFSREWRQAGGEVATAAKLGLLFVFYYGLQIYIKTLFPTVELLLPWYEYEGYFLLFCVLPYLITLQARRHSDFEMLYWWLIALLVVVLVIYWSSYSSFKEENTQSLRFRPFESVNPIKLVYASLAASTLAAWRVIVGKPGVVMKGVLIVIVISGLMLSLLGGQRQVVLSLVLTVGLFVILVRKSRKRGDSSAVFRFFLIFVVLALVVSMTIDMYEGTMTRLTETKDSVETGSEGRFGLWKEAIDVFLKNPIVGGGVQLPVGGSYPHNAILEAFMVSGIAGGALFIWYFLLSLKLAYRVAVTSDYGWVGIFHWQVAISSLFSGALYSNEWYWISSGLTISALRLDRRIKRRRMRRKKQSA